MIFTITGIDSFAQDEQLKPVPDSIGLYLNSISSTDSKPFQIKGTAWSWVVYTPEGKNYYVGCNSVASKSSAGNSLGHIYNPKTQVTYQMLIRECEKFTGYLLEKSNEGEKKSKIKLDLSLIKDQKVQWGNDVVDFHSAKIAGIVEAESDSEGPGEKCNPNNTQIAHHEVQPGVKFSTEFQNLSAAIQQVAKDAKAD